MSHWSKPVSTFGLLLVTTFIRSSHMLVVSAHPLLLSAFVLADSAWPRGSAYRLSGGYVVPRASHRAVAGSACPGRERLMEQPVSSGHTFSSETETQATFRSHVNVQPNVQRAILVHAGLRVGNKPSSGGSGHTLAALAMLTRALHYPTAASLAATGVILTYPVARSIAAPRRPNVFPSSDTPCRQ
jgi:hypothetical protein